MINRAMDANGDYVFGGGAGEFLVNTPAAVAQAVQTRLQLAEGEWFLDLQEGTPYSTEILGANTTALYDQAIRERILDTPGVVAIISYSSVLNNRALTVNATISTLYGQTSISQVL